MKYMPTFRKMLDSQARDLAFWKMVLKPEYFKTIETEVLKRSFVPNVLDVEAKTELELNYIFRGTDILNLVANLR